MKKIIIVFALSLIVCIKACSYHIDSNSLKFHYEADQVNSIQIIRLEEYLETNNSFEYSVLTDISDIKTFVTRLNKIKQSKYRGQPRTMHVQYVAIRIEFLDGSYDWIHPYAQYAFRASGVRNGYVTFNQKQFEALISDYL